MWNRQDFKCNHCNKKIIIKLQVEDLDSSKIIFHCPYCNSKISGDFNDNNLRLSNVTFVNRFKDEEIDYSIGYAGYLPCLISKGFDPISSFIRTAFSVCRTEAYNNNILFKELYKNKDYLLRINQFYFDENYNFLDSELEKLNFKSSLKINKEKALIRLNEFFILPILNKQNYKKLIDNYISLLQDNQIFNKLHLIIPLEPKINDLFSEITIFINEFYDLYPDFRSFLSIRDIQNDNSFYHLNFDFNKVKSFYVDIFELNCKIFNILGELLKISGYNLDLPQKKFKKMTNGMQIQQLEKISYFNIMKDILNHKMRNAIGHKSTKIEFNNQKIITTLNSKVKEYKLNEFFEKTIQNLELMFSNYYLLFSLKSILNYNNNVNFFEISGYELNKPRDLILNMYFSDCYITPKVLKKYNLRYWDILYIYNLNPKINLSLNNNKTLLQISFGQKIIDISKKQNSHWFRLAVKKGPVIKTLYDIDKIEIYGYLPKEFPE